MQRYTHERQAEAKAYMDAAEDPEVAALAVREYPDDYAMQRYVYDRQLAAKAHMR